MTEDHPLHLPGLGPDSVLAGYRLEARIGSGGMAVVYRARDERLRRLVALKVLSPQLASDSAFRRRFIGESLAAAAVDDPHIIPVYDAGEANGVLYIAMRFVQGGDLRAVLRREAPLTPARAVEFISPVASALDAAHLAGLVHRDVKPGNILVDSRPSRPDQVYLSDFGISKSVITSVTLTVAGHFIGTPEYSSPEQIDGAAVDGRADQYALACVSYQLLAGETPFQRNSMMAMLLAHVSQPPPPLTSRRSDLPVAVDQVMAKALAKNPGDRYPSCADFADALREALGLSSYYGRGRAEAPPAGTPPGEPAATPDEAPARGPLVPARTFIPVHPDTATPPPSSESPDWAATDPAVADRSPTVTGQGPAVAGYHPTVDAYDKAEVARVMAEAGEVTIEADRELATARPQPSVAADQAVPDQAVPDQAVPDQVVAAGPGNLVMFPVGADVVAGHDDAFRPTTGPGRRWRRRLPLIAVASVLVSAAVVIPFVLEGTAHSPGSGRPVSSSPTAPQSGSRGSPGSTDSVSGPIPIDLPPAVSAGAGKISWLAFSPSGETLAIADTGKICLRSIAARKCTATFTSAWTVAFSPDGATLAATDDTSNFSGIPNGTIRQWDVRSGKPHGPVLVNQASQGALCAAFSPDGKTLAVGDVNGSTYLWDAATGSLLGKLTDPGGTHVNAVAFSPDGSLAAGDSNGSTYLWNAGTKKLITRIHDPGGSGVQAVAFGKDGVAMAAASLSGSTYLWQRAAAGGWRLIKILPAPPAAGNDNTAIRAGALAFSQDGTRLAIGDVDGTTDLWDAVNWQLIKSLPDTDGGGETAVAFSRDGKTLATGDENGGVYLWRLG